MRGPFRAGEQVLLVDAKQRRYLVLLAEGGEFHTHTGVTAHDDLIGREEGVSVRSSSGARYMAMRPTLADFVLKMPRGAQVIYPKDLGPLLMLADIHDGVRVREARDHSAFAMAETIEVLQRSWHIEGQSVRPDHRMVAHTGFLTAARLLNDAAR